MSIEAMKQALEELEGNCTNPVADPEQAAKEDKAITALRTAIEQAEKQEPVAWQGVYDKTDLYYRKPPQADVRPLYTTPPAAQREWVGLTDDELVEMANQAGITYVTGHGVASATFEWLDRFAGLVAAREREACARMVKPVDGSLADEIRARGEK